MNNLATILWAFGDSSGARKLLEEALSVRRRVLGEEHPDTLISLHNLCSILDKSDGLEVDRQLVKALLAGVRKLPEGTPIRVVAEARWGRAEKE
jgi:Tetratricopeptide repeat